jgi:Flp pilus assembly protein TadG
MNLFGRLRSKINRLRHREEGSYIIELAIVFPILLLLFVGAAELGRLFYTYTTLAKATKVGARYLSNAKDLTSTNTSVVAVAKLKAQSLVVCGYETCSGNQPGGGAKVPIVQGLDMANPANSVQVTVFTQNEGTAIIRYVTVQIQGYTYARGIFSLSGMTGAADSAIYFGLTPKTTVRYMLAG